MNNGLYDGIQDYGGREENITFKASSQSYKISLYYLATFLKSFFFFYWRITLDKCYAWFHLCGLHWCLRNRNVANSSKCKKYVSSGILTSNHPHRTQNYHSSLNHSSTGLRHTICFKLLLNWRIWIKSHTWQYMYQNWLWCVVLMSWLQ